MVALVVRVEHVDQERATLLDGGTDPRVEGVVGIAQRSLPEADVVRPDVEVPELTAEPVEVIERCLLLDARRDVDAPRLEDGDARADVGERYREVDPTVHKLDLCSTAADDRHFRRRTREPSLHQHAV
jgi:hypothetical protein